MGHNRGAEDATGLLRRMRRASTIAGALPLVFFASVFLHHAPGYYRMFVLHVRQPASDAEIVGLWLLAAFGLGAAWAVRKLTARSRRLGDQLASATGMDRLGHLIEAAAFGRTEYHAPCATRLGAIAEVDIEGLTEVQRKALRRIATGTRFTSDRYYDLPVAALHALAVLGDLRALPQIERLAKRAKQPEVRAAATDTAARLRALQAGGTLLRPADGATEELLRPAGGAETETLLRASAAQGGANVEPNDASG